MPVPVNRLPGLDGIEWLATHPAPTPDNKVIKSRPNTNVPPVGKVPRQEHVIDALGLRSTGYEFGAGCGAVPTVHRSAGIRFVDARSAPPGNQLSAALARL